MEKKEIVLMWDMFVVAPVSTLIGIAAFIGCISAFGGWGLISLVLILPFMKHFYDLAKREQGIDKGKTDNDMNF